MASKTVTKAPARQSASPPQAKAGVPAPRNEKGGLPADLAKRMSSDAGKGVSTEQADNLVPIITILQDLSPQTKKRDAKFIEGAEASMIWLKNAEDPFVLGEEGIIFQPCFFDKDFVEWVPRDSGGGFVGRHRSMPSDAKEFKDAKNPNKVFWARPNGNQIVETRYHVGFVHRGDQRMAYVIPLSSTGHTTSKQWMFMMNNVQLPSGDKAPSFAKLYRLRTKVKTNGVGQSWYGFDVEDAGWVDSVRDYESGLALYNAFAQGERDIDTSTMEGGAGGGEGDDGRM